VVARDKGMSKATLAWQTKSLLRKYNIRPKKHLGQNFLIDEGILERIVEAADLNEDSIVVEIGPGIGALTRELAKIAKLVFAIELDENLVKLLRETLAPFKNIEFLHADVLKINFKELPITNYQLPITKIKVVANLPYYITTPILGRLLKSRDIFDEIIIMVQQEVANRMVAIPRIRDYGALSLLVQYYTRPEKAFSIPSNAFFPSPKVDSALVKMGVLPRPAIPVKNERFFFLLVRAVFGQRRKALKNVLLQPADFNLDKNSVLAILSEAGIKPLRRGETLSLKDFGRLSDLIAEKECFRTE